MERLGYTVIPHWQLDRHPTCRYTKKLFNLLQPDCVIDVGANAGQYHDFLRSEVGFQGTIWSFEPTPSLVEEMKARAHQDPKWIIEGMGLGSSSGTLTLNAMSGSQFNSFLAPDHSNVDMFRDLNKVTATIDVPVRTLDELLPSFLKRTLAKSIYLKLDTQGFDLEVIKGATASLPLVKGLQTEASVVPIYADSPDYRATIETIESKGFELSGIFPNNEGHFPRLIEFDCYFIARSSRPQ